jgi:hypothetical protein
LATIGTAACIGSSVLVGALATGASATTVTISGAATNAPNASCVYIENSNGTVAANTTTGGNGDFSASVTSGSYVVQIDPACFGTDANASEAGAYYDSGAINDATSLLAEATLVNATGGSVSGVNLTLSSGDTLSGTVLSGAGGTASGVCIYLLNPTDLWAYEATSTTGGAYSVSGIAPDATNGYEIEFDPSCGGTVNSPLAPTFWQNDALVEGDTPVIIDTTNQTMPNATVPVGGTISGTVTEPNGSAAPNVCVYVESSDADVTYVYAYKTGFSGTYSFPGLAATTFDVFYDPGCDGSQSTDFAVQEAGSALSVTPGATSTVSGTLVFSSGALSISPTTAATGTVGSAFSQGFLTSGGLAPFLWSAVNLPAGLSINAATGTVTGTPTTSGDTTATIVAADSSAQGVAISQSVTFVINPAPAPPTTTTTTLPYVPPAPTPKVTVGIASIVVKNGASASIPVSCATATCSGTVKLVEKSTSKVAYKKKVGKKTVTAYKTKTVITVLGSASFKLKKGKKASEVLVLNATGKKIVGGATTKKALHEFLETTVKGGRTTTKAVVVS